MIFKKSASCTTAALLRQSCPLNCLISHGLKHSSSSMDEKDVLKKWIEILRFQGFSVPKNITDEILEKLLKSEKNRRKNMLYYMSISEKHKILSHTRKLENKTKRRLIKERVESRSHINYNMHHNAMFVMPPASKVVHYLNYKVATQMPFNQNLVIDCSFSHLMRHREVSFFASEMVNMIKYNRNHKLPAVVHLCNFNYESECSKALENIHPILHKPLSPVHVTSKCYLETFPKNKLVYLTPNSANEMDDIEPDKVYIIGGIVDLFFKKPLTIAKARKQGIKTFKFPITKYFELNRGNNLGIFSSFSILLDKQLEDWPQALRHIPPKRLVNPPPDHRKDRKLISLRKTTGIFSS